MCTAYEIEFADGGHIIVPPGQSLLTDTHASRKAQARVLSVKDRCKSTQLKPELRSIEDIKNTIEILHGGRIRPNHSVATTVVEYKEKSLPMDPYVLGAWLGDGTGCTGVITTIDEDVLDRVRAAGFVATLPLSKKIEWRIEGLTKELRSLGVLSNKHVPEVYLTSSYSQRLALLQGLMDTDGTISKRGDCCFDNTNKKLTDAVAQILVSLGVKVNIQQRRGKQNGIDGKMCYRVHFTTDLPVFNIKRKLVRIRPVAMKAKRRYIVAVRGMDIRLCQEEEHQTLSLQI